MVYAAHTFEPWSSSLAFEQFFLAVVWNVSGEVGDLTDWMKLELLMMRFEKLILVFVGRIPTFSANGTTCEDSLVLGDLLLLASSRRRRRGANSRDRTIDCRRGRQVSRNRW